MTPISGITITFNEEPDIADCLASLRRVCDDVVVVDSGSTDRTR
jgi:glycosyltransferase involved in cell wall biosynthesis